MRRVVRRFTLSQVLASIGAQTLGGSFLPLYVRHLGFDAVQIGALASVRQFTTIARVISARFMDRHGCKRIMTTFLLLSPLGLIPFIAAPQIGRWLGPRTVLPAVFIGVVIHVLTKNVAMTGWRPMFRANVPLERSGSTFSRIVRPARMVTLVAVVVMSFLLNDEAGVRQFQFVFLFFAVIAFLRPLPLLGVRDAEPNRKPPKPLWKDLRRIWRNKPFRQIMILSAVWCFCGGLAQPFRVLFIRELGFSSTFAVIANTGVLLAASALALPFWGFVADRYGTRGMYGLAGTGVVLGHALLLLPNDAGRVDVALILGATALISASSGALMVANFRRILTVAPQENQSLYMVSQPVFASVAQSIGLFSGGYLLAFARTFADRLALPEYFLPSAQYRLLFAVTAALFVLYVALSQVLGDRSEMSAARLFSHLCRLGLRMARGW